MPATTPTANTNKLNRYFGANALGVRNWLTIASLLFIPLVFLLFSPVVIALIAPVVLFGLQIALAVLLGLALSAILFCLIVGITQDYREFKQQNITDQTKSYFSFLRQKFDDWTLENPKTFYFVVGLSPLVPLVLLNLIVSAAMGGISVITLVTVTVFCFIVIIFTEAICRGCAAIQDYFYPNETYSAQEVRDFFDQQKPLYSDYSTATGRKIIWQPLSEVYQKHQAIVDTTKIINTMEFIVEGNLQTNLKNQWKITYNSDNSSLTLSTFYPFSYEDNSSNLTEFTFTETELRSLLTKEQLLALKNLSSLHNDALLPQKKIRGILSSKKLVEALEVKINELDAFMVEVCFDPKTNKIAFFRGSYSHDMNQCNWLRIEEFEKLFELGHCLHRFYTVEPPVTKENIQQGEIFHQRGSTVIEEIDTESEEEDKSPTSPSSSPQ